MNRKSSILPKILFTDRADFDNFNNQRGLQISGSNQSFT